MNAVDSTEIPGPGGEFDDAEVHTGPLLLARLASATRDFECLCAESAAELGM